MPTLRDIRRKMIRKMLHFKRRDTEFLEDVLISSNHSINNLMRLHGVKSWDLMAHRSVFRWAGFLARLSVSAPERWTTRVFQHKDWAWIQVIARANNGRQLHGRYLRTWRWERPLYNYLGEKWQEQAIDLDNWKSMEEDFLKWRASNR